MTPERAINPTPHRYVVLDVGLAPLPRRAAMELDFAALGIEGSVWGFVADLYTADYGAPSSAATPAPTSTPLTIASPSLPVARLGQRGAGP